MFRSFCTTLAVASLGVCAFAQVDATGRVLPLTQPLKQGGTFHVASGTWQRQGSALQALSGQVLYDNTCATNFVLDAATPDWSVVDEGRIPSLADPLPGDSNRYLIESFDIRYCSSQLVSTDLNLGFYECLGGGTPSLPGFECYDQSANPTLVSSLLVAGAPASFLSGSLSCWSITVDLSGGQEFELNASCDGNYSGLPQTDLFGWEFYESTPGAFGGGPVLAGDSSVCAEGAGTAFSPTPGPGTGLGAQNLFTVYAGGPSYAGGLYDGCYLLFPSPLSSLQMVLRGKAVSPPPSSPIYGLNLALSRLYSTYTASFVADYAQIGGPIHSGLKLDFDASATTLWAVRHKAPAGTEYGTVDLGTGTYSPIGMASGLSGGTVRALTCSVDGDWYLVTYSASFGSRLFVGDVSSGSFSLVGTITPDFIIDIAIDSQGNLYGINASDDALYSIDTNTAVATLIGPTGQPADSSQGIDFDWSNDRLYATLLNENTATGVFARMDLSSGQAQVLENTASLGGELILALRVPAPCPIVEYCGGDGSGSPCPAANDNDGSNGVAGCANSAEAGGGKLGYSGCSSSGDLALVGSSLVPGQPGLYFQADNAVNAGNGNAFGNGLRCAGGNVVRLQVRTANGSGSSSTTVDLASVGGVSPGQTKRYQLWYRDPAGGGTGFNFTNGLAVSW